MEVTRETVLSSFPGVGPVRAKALARLGLETVGDLLGHYPRQYEDRTTHYPIAEAPLGIPVCITAMVAQPPVYSHIRKGLDLVKVRVVDDSGALQITFFNQPYIKEALTKGNTYTFYGKVDGISGYRSMTSPAFEPEEKARFTGRIMPIYPRTAGVSNNLLAGLALQGVEGCIHQMEDTLPPALLAEYSLSPLPFALENIHFPASWQALERAKERLAFEELFYLSAGLALLKTRRTDTGGTPIAARPLDEFAQHLPFALTGAQRRVMAECAADMASAQPMNRLVQGDVGAGKTAIAAWALWLCALGGGQGAMMAPTELLATQHHASLTALLSPSGIQVGLLTASLSAGEKRAVKTQLASGDLKVVVGTHALLSKGVDFSNLTLVVADEQHRFGVNQRAALSAKGVHAHTLVMSATPIPRTLALIIYGDLEVSALDELPPGRQPVDTMLVGEDKRERLYGFIEKLVGEGRQVYIVCPAVEEGEAGMDLKSVKQYAAHLATAVFPQLRVGLVYGKQKAKEKEATMGAFSQGTLDVLVSTTVIEVGVDIPNAALMIIENADRFGLSQLHQLRGRVGRSGHQSYCVLVTASHNPDTRARLKALCSTTDGFKIAEEDLKQRGPGDFFGARQHGLPALKLADLTGDMRVFSQAQQAARQLIAQDNTLSQLEHRPILEKVRTLFAENPDIFN